MRHIPIMLTSAFAAIFAAAATAQDQPLSPEDTKPHAEAAPLAEADNQQARESDTPAPKKPEPASRASTDATAPHNDSISSEPKT